MTRRLTVLMVCAMTVVGLAGCKQMHGAHKGNVQSAGDAGFMREAAQGNEAEVEMGRIAVQRAVNPDVRAFGQRMIDDHSKANGQLMQLASNKEISLPTEPNLAQRMTADSLQKKSGEDFDKTYMKTMVEDHEKDVKAYENEINTGKDPDVLAYARDTLPILKEHLGLARQADAEVSGKTK